MSGGGGGGGSSHSVSLPVIPDFLKDLLQSSAGNWQTAMNAAGGGGGLAGLLNPNPEQIAQLTPAELANINQLQGFATSGTPGEQAAQAQINQLTSGAIGSSPATQAAMRAYNQNIAPTISSSLGATGGGRGGALTAALTQGQTNAYVPLLNQEIGNREAAVGQEMGLGSMQTQDVQNALNASDMIRQIQQAGLSSQFQDFLRRSGLIQQFVQGPLELWGGQDIGQQSWGQQSSSGGGGLF